MWRGNDNFYFLNGSADARWKAVMGWLRTSSPAPACYVHFEYCPASMAVMEMQKKILLQRVVDADYGIRKSWRSIRIA